MKVAHCIHLNQLTLQIPDAEQYPMEFSVISNARSFTAMANSVEERDEWVEAIHTAKVNYEENLKTFAGMRPKSEIGLGDIAPVWIPDDRVTACQVTTNLSQSDPHVAALPHVVWDQICPKFPRMPRFVRIAQNVQNLYFDISVDSE